MVQDMWLTDPQQAYAEWQRDEATGADRRPFANRSIVQHRSMFARFHRFLVDHRRTVATFEAEHIDAFFSEIANDCAPGTTTHLRYLKLIDRFSRYLVAMEVRASNPAAAMLARESWPEDEPSPVFLALDDDRRLQQACFAESDAPFKDLRNIAVVALILGTGITAAESRYLRVEDLNADGMRPDVYIEKRGPRIARRVPLDRFATNVLSQYKTVREHMPCATDWLFIATAAGKPMKDDTLGQCVRAALKALNIVAVDMSPRLLRNTFGRRHIHEGKTNETVSNLLGLSSHRTAARLRETLDLLTETES